MTIKERIEKLEDIVTTHLKESGSIQTNLKWNTWLTGVILVALLSKFIAEWFKN